MRSRAWVLAAALAAGMPFGSSSASGLEFREEPYRVGIVDVGEPVLLEYAELTNEMNLNSELRDWIEAYGRPEYAEYQKVAMSDPFFPYEVRLYYIEGRRYVAFGRVAVSASLTDFGVRKYIGKLDSAMLQRLLTARPLAEAARMAAAERVEYGSPAYRAPAPAAAVEVEAEEAVVEIVSPETVVVAEEIEIERVDGTEVEVEKELVVEEVEAVDGASDAVSGD